MFIILPNDKDDIFVTSLSILYCSFSFLTLSSIVRISFYIPFKRLFLKREGLPDAKVACITKKEYGFVGNF